MVCKSHNDNNFFKFYKNIKFMPKQHCLKGQIFFLFIIKGKKYGKVCMYMCKYFTAAAALVLLCTRAAVPGKKNPYFR